MAGMPAFAALIIACLALSACEPSRPQSPAGAAGPAAPSAPAASPVAPPPAASKAFAAAGAIAGRIVFRGEVPEELREPIVPTPCGDGAGPEKLLVSRDGGVANAVVVVLVPSLPGATEPGSPAVTVDNRG